MTETTHEIIALPQEGFVRLPVILKVYPIGESTWWRGVKEGTYPKPTKLGARSSAWRVEEIRELISNPPIH